VKGIAAAGAFAIALYASSGAYALGPALGLDADIGQLNSGLYESDPASNAPNAGGIFTDLTGSNFTVAPGPHVRIRSGEPRFRVIRAPRIIITP
jgi:hypothetical protein